MAKPQGAFQRFPAQAGTTVIGAGPRKRDPRHREAIPDAPTSWPPGRRTPMGRTAPAGLSPCPIAADGPPRSAGHPQGGEAREGLRRWRPGPRLAWEPWPRPAAARPTGSARARADLRRREARGPAEDRRSSGAADRKVPGDDRPEPPHRSGQPEAQASARPSRASATRPAGRLREEPPADAGVPDAAPAAAEREHRMPPEAPSGAPARLAGERASTSPGWRERANGRGPTGISLPPSGGRECPRLPAGLPRPQIHRVAPRRAVRIRGVRSLGPLAWPRPR
jgi:hypothetical protein